jgi:hypothetical protein
VNVQDNKVVTIEQPWVNPRRDPVVPREPASRAVFLLTDGARAHLTGVSRQCVQLHAALYQSYISYPIESALPA